MGIGRGGLGDRRVASVVLWVASGGATFVYWLGCWLLLPLIQPPAPFVGAPTGEEVLRGGLLLLALGLSTGLRVIAANMHHTVEWAPPRDLRRALRRRVLAMLAVDSGVFAIVLLTLATGVGLVHFGALNRVLAWVSVPRLLAAIAFWPLLAVAFAAGVLRTSRRVATDAPYCSCGYSLKGNVSRICPECGRPVADSGEEAAVESAAGDAVEPDGGPSATGHRIPFIVVSLLLVVMGMLSLVALPLVTYRVPGPPSGALRYYWPVGFGFICLNGGWFQLAFVPVRTARQRAGLYRFIKVEGAVDALLVALGVAFLFWGMAESRGSGPAIVSIPTLCFWGLVGAWETFSFFALVRPVYRPDAPCSGR